jgi:hypothetical protein
VIVILINAMAAFGDKGRTRLPTDDTTFRTMLLMTSRATRSSEATDSQNKLVKHAKWMSGGSRSFVRS